MQNHSRSDLLALTIAHDLHDLIAPLATILFGSRARGDHRPDSDLDVLIIQNGLPDHSEYQRIKRLFQSLIDRLYPTSIKAHLTFFDAEAFDEEDTYFNSRLSRALIEGTIFTDHPNRFTSRYNADDPPAPLFRWDSYQEHLLQSREHLKAARIAVANHTGDVETRESIKFQRPWEFPVERGDLTLDNAAADLTRAMRNALAAAVTANLGIVKLTDQPQALIAKLRRLAPSEDLTTTIPTAAYSDRNQIIWDRQTVDSAIADVENIRNLN